MNKFVFGVLAVVALYTIFGEKVATLVVAFGVPASYLVWMIVARRKYKLFVEDRYIRTRKRDAEVVAVVSRHYSSPDVVLSIRTLHFCEEFVVIAPRSNPQMQVLEKRDMIHIVFAKPADGGLVIAGENLIDIRSLEGDARPKQPNPADKDFAGAFDPS